MSKTATVPRGTTKLNPTITAMFDNEKFGYGSKISVPIDEKGFDVVQKNLTIGSRLLFKKSKSTTKEGNPVYFLEILPPYEKAANNNGARGTRKAAASNTDSEI